jgi:hypothetical protein
MQLPSSPLSDHYVGANISIKLAWKITYFHKTLANLLNTGFNHNLLNG